jgi:hypothetical protein
MGKTVESGYPVMTLINVLIILGLLNFSLVLVMGWLFWQERSYLRELFPKNDARDIRNKFREVIEAINYFDNHAGEVDRTISNLKKEMLNHTQNIAVSKYNPYGDTGGDQSFTVVMLDGRWNGFMFTSLHSRAGTRVYLKNIKSGKSDLELSKEEKEVLEQALK